MGSAFEAGTYDLLNRKNIFTSIQAAMPHSRARCRFAQEVAPSGFPGQYPEQGSAGRWERIFQVSPLQLALHDIPSKKKVD